VVIDSLKSCKVWKRRRRRRKTS